MSINHQYSILISLYILGIVRHFLCWWQNITLGNLDGSDQLEKKEDDFDATYDGESSEEAHGASNETQLSLHLDLLVSLNVVEGRRVKVDLNQLQSWLRQLLSWSIMACFKTKEAQNFEIETYQNMTLAGKFYMIYWNSEMEQYFSETY